MKALSRPFAKFLFMFLAVILFTWTGRLTVNLVNSLLPNLAYAGVFALVLFDGGTLAWLYIFVNGSEGVGQRITAIIMTVFDLAGVGIVTLAELYLGGQSLVDVPETIPELALWIVGVYTLCNVAAVVTFHLLDPGAVEAIMIQAQRDKLRDKSLEKLQGKMDEVADTVADDLAEGLRRSVLETLHIDDNKAPTTNGANPTKAAVGK